MSRIFIYSFVYLFIYLFIYLFFQVGGFGPCGITNKIAYFSSVNTWLPLSSIPHIECSNFGKFFYSEYAFLILLHSLIFSSHESNRGTQKAGQFCQIQLLNNKIDQTPMDLFLYNWKFWYLKIKVLQKSSAYFVSVYIIRGIARYQGKIRNTYSKLDLFVMEFCHENRRQ